MYQAHDQDRLSLYSTAEGGLYSTDIVHHPCEVSAYCLWQSNNLVILAITHVCWIDGAREQQWSGIEIGRMSYTTIMQGELFK